MSNNINSLNKVNLNKSHKLTKLPSKISKNSDSYGFDSNKNEELSIVKERFLRGQLEKMNNNPQIIDDNLSIHSYKSSKKILDPIKKQTSIVKSSGTNTINNNANSNNGNNILLGRGLKSRELIVENKANKLILDGKDLKLSNNEKAKLNPISSLNKISNQNNKANTNIASSNINSINNQNKNSFYESSVITELSKGLLTNKPHKNQKTQIERTTNATNTIAITQNFSEIQSNNLNSSTQLANKPNQNDVEIKKQEQKSEMLFSSIIKDQFKHEFHEIHDFMEGLGLSQFTNNFIKRGVTTIEKVLNCDDKDITELIKGEGFRIKLRLKIKEIKQRKIEVLEDSSNYKNKEEIENNIDDEDSKFNNNLGVIKETTSKPVTNFAYDELPEGFSVLNKNIDKDKEPVKYINSITIKKLNSSASNVKKNINKGNQNNILVIDNDQANSSEDEDLKRIEEYEAEQRRLFQQAVMDFRNRNNNNKTITSTETETNTENYNNHIDITKKNNFSENKKSVKFNINNKVSTAIGNYEDTIDNINISNNNNEKFLYNVGKNDKTNNENNDMFDFGQVIFNNDISYNTDNINYLIENNKHKDDDLNNFLINTINNSKIGINNNEDVNDYDTANKKLLTLNAIKLPCFNCYKFVELTEQLNKSFTDITKVGNESGVFCSKECENLFVKENIKKCVCCGSNFIKYKGIYNTNTGVLYCKEDCLEKELNEEEKSESISSSKPKNNANDLNNNDSNRTQKNQFAEEEAIIDYDPMLDF